MKTKKSITAVIAFLLIFVLMSVTAWALNWDGSSAGGSTNAVNGSSKGYVIRSTSDDAVVVGYRFSVVDLSGNLKVNKVIDVYRNTVNGDNAYSTSAKFSTKYNKKQIITNKNAKLSTTNNTTNCFKESGMGFASKLPNPSGVETWQKYEANINKVLGKIGAGTVSNLSYGDKVIIEPLFDVCLAGEYQALTVSEIAYCGRSVKGGSSDGGTSNGTSSTWGFIANYTNRIWPNKLYTPDGQGLWTSASRISDGSKATFDTILTKGYGAGIAYAETTAPVLTICYDCYGSNVTSKGTSSDYKLGDYNRIISTTKTNKTIAGTQHVLYHTLKYNNAIGGTGLYNFSTFALNAPTGYTFSSWYGNGKNFDQDVTTYKPSDFSDSIKSGDDYVWLSAKFKPITYTVKYDGNGNTGGSTASSTHTYDTAKNLTANGFTKTGYSFAGWNTKADGTGTNYSNQQSVKNLSSTQGATINLYAKWTSNSYTVSYNANGGTGAPANQTKQANVSLTLSTVKPTRTGYTFTGWNTKSDGSGTNYSSGGSYTGNANLTLYAKWTANTLTLCYDCYGSNVSSNGSTTTYYLGDYNRILSKTMTNKTIAGTNNVLYHTLKYNNAIGGNGLYNFSTFGLNAPMGYTFNSWKWNGKSFDQDITTYKPTDFTDDIKTGDTYVWLTAQFKPITYTVKYNGNGNTGGSTASSTHTYDVAKNLTANGFTKTGYSFAGWNTKADGTGTNYTNKQSVKNLSSAQGATINLYAKWTPNTYTVSYNANGGTGAPASQTKTHGVSLTLSSVKPTRTGYSFNGWNTKSDGTGTNYSSGGSYTGNANLTLYAKWTPNTYTVSYNANGGSGAPASQTKTHGVSFTLSSVKPTRTGYSFNGWNTKSDGTGTNYSSGGSYTGNANLTLYAKWTPNTYTVSYNANGGSGAPANQTKTYGVNLTLSSSKPTRSGYNFKSWNTKSDGTGKTYSPSDIYTENTNLTLYAQWVEGVYTVSYDANGGTGAPSKQTKTYNVDLTLSTVTPTRTGYTFSKWNTKADGKGTSYSPGGKYTANADAVMYAQWTPVTYTVSYDANGGSSAPAKQTKTYGVSLTLTSSKPTKTGYSFVKWNTKADGTGTSYNPASVYTTNADMKLYAIWTVNNYTVSYNANGGTNAPANQTKTYGTALTLSSATPTRTGYTFVKWNTKADGTGTNYQPSGRYTANSDAVMYAQWTPVTYTVSYDANGGANAPVSQTKTYGVSLTLTSSQPTRTGYTFVKWNTKADGTGTSYSPASAYTSNSDMKLYAIWNPVTYTVSYNANGGTNAPASQTKTYGVDLTLTSSKPIKTGYDFVKWNTKQDGTGIDYLPNDKYTENANIVLYAVWQEEQSLKLEAVEPNAKYREGTQVISSFHLINESNKDRIPNNNVSVEFKVYSGSSVIYTVTKNNCVVPAQDKNLLYFKWTVPENISGNTITITGEIIENSNRYGKISHQYETCKYIISQTPDTQYAIGMPSGFSVPDKPQTSNTTAKWSEWKYIDGAFKKVNYSVAISPDGAVISPDASANATKNGEMWTAKSGYGINISMLNNIIGLPDYEMPDSDAYTLPQYSTVLFPEFSFLNTFNNYRTLELINNQWIFRNNADYGRIHFTPLWYPDGMYSVSVVQRDCWTPAGMISRTVNSNEITISGSAYDDWYIS